MLDGVFEFLELIATSLQEIFNLVVSLGSAIVDVIVHLTEAISFIVSIAPFLPAPIATILLLWGAIMMLYSIKGS